MGPSQLACCCAQKTYERLAKQSDWSCCGPAAGTEPPSGAAAIGCNVAVYNKNNAQFYPATVEMYNESDGKLVQSTIAMYVYITTT